MLGTARYQPAAKISQLTPFPADNEQNNMAMTDGTIGDMNMSTSSTVSLPGFKGSGEALKSRARSSSEKVSPGTTV